MSGIRVTVAMLVGLAASPVHIATAQNAPSALEITESQRRLDQIRGERGRLREEMTRIRSRVSDLSTELENVRQQVNASSNLLSELDTQLEQRELQISQNTQDLEDTRLYLADREAVLHARLRQVYKRGPLQTLQVLLAAETFSDLFNRYKYLLLTARYDRQLAAEVGQLENQLVRRERDLRAEALQLESVRRERAGELTELTYLQQQQTQALGSVRDREETARERMAQLEADEAGMSAFLADVERNRQATGGIQPSRSAGGSAPDAFDPRTLGALPWPLNGPVLYEFGGSADGAGGNLRRTGMGIGAVAGEYVRAIAPGQIVLAGRFEGYGPSVVISHGGGHYSLYLYLASVNVAAGQRVATGHALGIVNAGGNGGTPFFELQLRAPGGTAVDPRLWLVPQ